MSSNISSDINEYIQYRIGNYIWIYISPILIIIGTVGNILSVIVLLRPTMRKSTTMFYLACLSLGDMLALYTGLLRFWIRHAFDIDVRNLSSASCKIHTFMVYVSLDFTVWILASLTIDRCVHVSLPLKSKRICFLIRSKWIVCIILLLVFVKNMHFFWTSDLETMWEFRCDANSDSAFYFYFYVWPWIDFSTFCLIPSTVMITCNIKIIYEMVVSQRKLDSHAGVHSNPSSSPGKTQRQLSVPGTSGQCRSATLPARSVKKTSRVESISETKATTKSRWISSLTIMLLSINCVFVITTSPIEIFMIGEIQWFPHTTPAENAQYHMWWAIVNILQYINNAIHFFLYCLTSPRFRLELKSMFKRHNQIAPSKNQTRLPN